MSEQQQTDKSSLGQKIECCLKYPFTKLINAITHLLKEFKDAEKLPALFVISIVILSLAVMTYFKNSSELVTIVVYSIAIGCIALVCILYFFTRIAESKNKANLNNIFY